jgi:2-polyprenyl-3-methyl-5-hydroxy-6-metoxy-1,4-benzoquinol methylase
MSYSPDEHETTGIGLHNRRSTRVTAVVLSSMLEAAKRSTIIGMKARWRLPTRIDGEEWLDLGYGTPEAIDRSLADLSRINRWLGGTRGLATHLYPRIRGCRAEQVRVLDLGAGGCTIPQTLARWARRESIPVRIFAVDLRHAHLRWARRNLQTWPEITFVQGDVLAPAMAEASVDFVISSLFLHHFTTEALIQVLPAWVGLARQSLIMTDLVRHPVPYWFMKAASPVFAHSAITRHDAAVSIRRAYRPHELYRIANEAGFAQARVYAYFPYRMTLVIDRVESGAT